MSKLPEGWICSFEELNKLERDRDCVTVDLGHQYINPKDIIGLSRIPEEDRLNYLRNKITVEGWIDISPNSILLQLLPNGKYIVAEGGNHRAYLSRELEIERIKANVCVFVDMNLLSSNDLKRLKEIDKQRELLVKKTGQNSLDELEKIEALNQERNELLVSAYFRINKCKE